MSGTKRERERMEAAWLTLVGAGVDQAEAAARVGYARPIRAAQRLAARFADRLKPQEVELELDPATRIERTLERLDKVVTFGKDSDAVTAARSLITECKSLVEAKAAATVWFIQVDNSCGPLPPQGPYCHHVLCDSPERIAQVLAALEAQDE